MKLLPDVEILSSEIRLAPSSTDCIDFIHRRSRNTDVYFIRSAYAQQQSFSIAFRANRPAELWDPISGEIHRAVAISRNDQQTTLRLTLPANGSIAVVFTDHVTGQLQPQLVRTEPVTADWTLTFPQNPPIKLSGLVSWTSLGSERYFSGTAIYRAAIMAPSLRTDESACLSFTAVHEIATVTLNGIPQPL